MLFESKDDPIRLNPSLRATVATSRAAMVRFLSEISAYQLRRLKGICRLVNLIDCSYRNDVRRFESTRDSYFLALIDSEVSCIR